MLKLKVTRCGLVMDKIVKQDLIKTNQLHETDTGSSKVQISLLKHQITVLSQHLKKNVKDIVARRILLKKVAKHRKLLKLSQNLTSSDIKNQTVKT